jgi:hypothetical protein
LSEFGAVYRAVDARDLEEREHEYVLILFQSV